MVTEDAAVAGGQSTGELRTIGLPDGRTMQVLTAGAPDGLPLVMHHGTPGAPIAWPATIESATVRGLRLILPARPGYAGSTPRPGRRVADVAGDVAAVLDALGGDAFITTGWSGGGPHALACSAVLRGRCLATAAIASVAPHRADGLDWLAGMGPENVTEFGAAARGKAELSAFLNDEGAALRTIQGADLIAGLGGLLSEADKAVLTGEFADHSAASLRMACSQGIEGWRDDDLAFVSDWGFPLEEAGKVAIWQGSEDLMVPQAHGAWLAKHIPGAQSRMRRGDGHLTFAARGLGEVLDDLIDLAGL